MKKEKHIFKKFSLYFHENKMKIFYHYLLALFIISLFASIDLLSKTFLFDLSKNGETQYENAIFGIRSIKNEGTTIFNKLNISNVKIFMHVLSISIIIFIFVLIFFLKRTIFVIPFSLLLSGVIGNGFDRFYYGWVRDIIYISLLDFENKGTFNLADVFLAIGMIFIIFIFIYDLTLYFLENKKNKKENKKNNFQQENQKI